jgi:hypothetical protein
MSYSRKGGEDSSHSIIYEKDGKLFVSYKKIPARGDARENRELIGVVIF